VKKKKTLSLLLTAFILSSCHCSTYHGSEEDITPKQKPDYAYIFDSRLTEVREDSCQIIGTFDGNFHINRKCRLSEGYIELGTENVFSKTVYSVNADIFISDTLYIGINQDKQIYFFR